MTESENPFRRPTRAAEPGTGPVAERPAGPDPQGSPPDGSPPADAGAPPSGSSPERHPPASPDAVEGANDLWGSLGDAVGPPPSDSGAEEGKEPAEPGIPGDSFGAPPATEPSADDEAISEAESVVLEDLSKLAAERDDYLLQLQRLTADFDNYRKRILKQQSEASARAAEALVEKLLEVLDTFDMALSHGEGFDQVYGALFSLLEKEGLERVDPAGKPFDPNEADAVAHEEGDEGPVVADVLRPGYRWKGRVLRPAMVKVRG